ncbi:MAG: phosphomannomutase/phosphoglucomutase [Pirellulales bacterium]|nr:phosphomannomutase/phosphoglucomutase [Pirellulales bacterium]
MSIYKPCDIRGHAMTELTPELYQRWGQALGRQLQPGAKFVVGGDVRMSTPAFLAALVDGLCRAGIDVVDLGTLPTPIIYYAKHRLMADACAIVTASHNPPDDNGLKWLLGNQPPTQEQVAILHRMVDEPEALDGRVHRAPRRIDITFDYVAWLQELWSQRRPVRLHTVLDPMHGCWAGRARRYLHAIFPQVLLTPIHDTPDAVFDGRCPDSSRHELLEELSEAVDHQRADLGVAFDGDGDRITFVDDDGVILTGEETAAILLESFGEEIAGQPFVYDLKFSDRIPELAKTLGARPIVERSGHAFLRARMLESGALFGAEISGHYFYRDLEGGDDALYTACRLIDHLARTGKSLTELRRAFPEIFVTPDLRVPVDPAKCETVLAHVRSAWSEYPQTTVDGVRIQFPDGWALVRASVTEPAMTFRFEASSLQGLYELVWRFCDSLPEIGDPLWSHYEEAMGGT